jgi:hypothetical protein
MTRALGHEHFSGDASLFEKRGGVFGTITSGVEATASP